MVVFGVWLVGFWFDVFVCGLFLVYDVCDVCLCFLFVLVYTFV